MYENNIKHLENEMNEKIQEIEISLIKQLRNLIDSTEEENRLVDKLKRINKRYENKHNMKYVKEIKNTINNTIVRKKLFYDIRFVISIHIGKINDIENEYNHMINIIKENKIKADTI